MEPERDEGYGLVVGLVVGRSENCKVGVRLIDGGKGSNGKKRPPQLLGPAPSTLITFP